MTTNSNHSLGIVANVLDGDFTADAPNRKWADDPSYIWTRQGWLYLAVILAVILGLHSRRVVGWARSDRKRKNLAIKALDPAVHPRNPPVGRILHSDHGGQYCSYDYQKKMQAHGLQPSMSGKGNCYDNASVATFFKTTKAKLIWRQSWAIRRKGGTAVFQYINGFYDSRRHHPYLGGISPLAFDAGVALMGPASSTLTQNRPRKCKLAEHANTKSSTQ